MRRCLSLLYNEATKEGSNLIDTATPKALFVYRFSGKGETYPPTAKIKWRGKNVLLGHIIRCLLSDNKYAPEDMGVASDFFESKSGKSINLATAKQVPVIDYEKERNNLDSNFVEGCGTSTALRIHQCRIHLKAEIIALERSKIEMLPRFCVKLS